MIKSIYFKETVVSELNRLANEVDLPNDFRTFYSEYYGEPTVHQLKPESMSGVGLGFDINGKFYLFSSMLSKEEFTEEIVHNLEGSIKKLGLLKFANNEFSEGGYYLGIGEENKGVYFYKNYLDWAEKDEIVLLAHSFSEFINKLRPVGITFSETSTEYQYLREEFNENGELVKLTT